MMPLSGGCTSLGGFPAQSPRCVVAMDFFTVPTLTFRVLYCFFVIEHGRRRIVHFSVTEHPTGPWIVQQLMEAFRAYVLTAT